MQGVEKEKLKGQIRPVAINFGVPEEKTCITIAMYDGEAWAGQEIQKDATAKAADVYVVGPGTTTKSIATKIATIEGKVHYHCHILEQLQ